MMVRAAMEDRGRVEKKVRLGPFKTAADPVRWQEGSLARCGMAQLRRGTLCGLRKRVDRFAFSAVGCRLIMVVERA